MRQDTLLSLPHIEPIPCAVSRCRCSIRIRILLFVHENTCKLGPENVWIRKDSQIPPHVIHITIEYMEIGLSELPCQKCILTPCISYCTLLCIAFIVFHLQCHRLHPTHLTQ